MYRFDKVVNGGDCYSEETLCHFELVSESQGGDKEVLKRVQGDKKHCHSEQSEESFCAKKKSGIATAMPRNDSDLILLSELKRDDKVLNLFDKFEFVWSDLFEDGYLTCHSELVSESLNAKQNDGIPDCSGMTGGGAEMTKIYFLIGERAGFTDTRVIYSWLKSWEMFNGCHSEEQGDATISKNCMCAKFYLKKVGSVDLQKMSEKDLEKLLNDVKKQNQKDLLYSKEPRIG